MKDLLVDARQEILSLRRENEILQAKVGVMDLFACVLHTQPARQSQGMAPDVAHALHKKITELDEPSGTSQVSVLSALMLIEELPKTSDGSPIVPDMVVYLVIGDDIEKRKVIGPCGKKFLWTFEPTPNGAFAGSAHRSANTVYATREAAQGALEEFNSRVSAKT